MSTLPKNENGLTRRQQLFADAYLATGSASLASREVGVAEATGNRYHRLPEVKAYIKRRSEAAITPDSGVAPVIKTKLEREAYWSRHMDDPSIPPKDRLKASELLGKAQGDFIQRHEHTVVNGPFMSFIVGDITLDQLDDESLRQLRELLERVRTQHQRVTRANG